MTTCTPKNTKSPNGDCGTLTMSNKVINVCARLKIFAYLCQCSAYCQESLSWNYGTEVPFQNAFCQKDEKVCTITNTATTSVTNSKEFSVGVSVGNKRSLAQRAPDAAAPAIPLSVADLKTTFNAGASWTYSDTYTNATAVAASRPDMVLAKCGYITFVPYYVT